MNNSDDVGNALIQQRDELATMIVNAQDASELERAERQVRFVSDLWLALGYGFKLTEMRSRVVARADELLNAENEYLSKCRKNCPTRHSTEKNIRRLTELSAI